MTQGYSYDDAHDDAYDDDAPVERGGSVVGRVIGLLALGTVLTYAWRSVRSTQERRVIARSAPLPERLQTWEGEGGRPDPEPLAGSIDSPAAGRTVGTAPPTVTGVRPPVL